MWYILRREKREESMSEERECIDNVESLERALARVRKAQEIFGTYSQEQVDKYLQQPQLQQTKHVFL